MASQQKSRGVGRDEIIDAIVDNLRPWKNGHSHETVSAALRNDIEVLVHLIPLQKAIFDPRPNREHAKKLVKAFRTLEKLLALTPRTLATLMFSPAPPITWLDEPIEVDGKAFVATVGPVKSLDESLGEYWAKFDAFIAEIRRLRDVCARDHGLHPNYDHAKNLSAEFAYGLIKGLSEKKITGTENQSFRITASLLYEAVTGEQDADLMRNAFMRIGTVGFIDALDFNVLGHSPVLSVTGWLDLRSETESSSGVVRTAPLPASVGGVRYERGPLSVGALGGLFASWLQRR